MDIQPGSIIHDTNPPVKIVGEMTLRDYFAAKAMQGILAFNGGNNCKDAQVAEGCYDMADAMLKAKNAKKS